MHPFRYLNQHRYVRNTLLMLGVFLLVLPAALSDGHERHAQKPDRQVAYVFKGTFHAAGPSVSVVQGNRHVRRAGLVGQEVAFDLSTARVRVADVNGDGMRNSADLQRGRHRRRQGAPAASHARRRAVRGPQGRRPDRAAASARAATGATATASREQAITL